MNAIIDHSGLEAAELEKARRSSRFWVRGVIGNEFSKSRTVREAGKNRRPGTQLGFHLTGEQCELLRQEAAMYYQRYLSLFVLEDFNGVLRDTARNLRVLDLCGKYAENEQDRLILEQYRPYITMMNTRAAASLHYAEKRFPQALAAIDEGLESIRGFFARFGQEEAFEQSHEVKVLRRMAREV